MGRFFFVGFGALSFVIFLLFFPIYLQTDAYYDMNGRKLAFSVRAFRFLKLLGGYIATYKGGFAVHLSEKKAVLIPYSDMENERKKIIFLKSIRLKNLEVTTETGAEYLLIVGWLQTIFRIFFFILGGKKENLDNNLWLFEGDVLRISIRCSAWINVISLLRNYFRKLKENRALCQTKTRKSTI